MEPSIPQFTLLFYAATAGMLLMALAIVFFAVFYQKRMLENKLKQQQVEAEYQIKMLQATLHSQEIERKKLAAELHDSIGAMLSAIRANVATMEKKGLDEKNLNLSKNLLDDTIFAVRKIGRDLMPLSLQKLGLSSAIKEMCQQYSAASGIEISFTETGESRKLDDKQSISLFRVLQELVNNAIKHAKTAHIEIDFQWKDDLLITIKDNGVGFDFEKHKEKASGLGLFNIENRLLAMSAKYSFENDSSFGMKTTISVAV